MNDIIEEYLKGDSFAVVGASRNPSKFGYKVFINLINRGKKVYPVNPNAETIAGIKAYKDIHEIPDKLHGVHFIVPPKITENILQDVKKLGIKYVWMQPGAESEKAIDYCRKNGIKAIFNNCILRIN